jgi:ethanolamine ammonia-lyase large subunit
VTPQQIVGAANMFKEGDAAIGVCAADATSRAHARTLLSRTPIAYLTEHPLHRDELHAFTIESLDPAVYERVARMSIAQLKTFVLERSEGEVKALMPGLPSDAIAAAVKLMSNEELVRVGQKIFNPLPGTQIGAKGYLSARLQPNSPTDNPEDIFWQVMNGFSFATGDLVLGTNPVSGSTESIARVEAALKDIVESFSLRETLPWCVLSHVDTQAAVAARDPSLVPVMFQSLAGTDSANKTFDLSVAKMKAYAASGQPGFYFETGQGADFTNGGAHGVDMVTLEARKYGFARALNQVLAKTHPERAWSHTNDVAGFIGPEVFKTREQLVRCCLEDIAMGKLHGLCLGLDVCSTLHMSLSPADLDWCLDEIARANPAYLMALPTKNDPMLSYMTTSFQDHVRLREKFGYRINDAMWAFFQRLGIVDARGTFTDKAGDPLWVYYQYRLAKGDTRPRAEIEAEGRAQMQRVQNRGVPLAISHGDKVSEPKPELLRELDARYADSKHSLYARLTPALIASIPGALPITTLAKDRDEFIAKPTTGEALSPQAIAALTPLAKADVAEALIIVSDGLNATAISDANHLRPLLETLRRELGPAHIVDSIPVITNGRVRAGYAAAGLVFKNAPPIEPRTLIHIIGERPGTAHHNYSVYVTRASAGDWGKGKIDHDITRVISGISDTALAPEDAATQVAQYLRAV